MGLSSTDHKRVSDAITSAERKTSGEIFCVLAQKTDDFQAIPFAWAALVALVMPPLLLWSGVISPQTIFGGGWEIGSGEGFNLRSIVELYAGLSAALFILGFLLTRMPGIKRHLIPRSLRHAAVHRTAMESFLAHGIHVTENRTGILIFLSLEDRIAEVVADEAIYKRVDNAIWGDAVSSLRDHAKAGDVANGFIDAIQKCADVLGAHFPPRDHNPNELPDKLIEI